MQASRIALIAALAIAAAPSLGGCVAAIPAGAAAIMAGNEVVGDRGERTPRAGAATPASPTAGSEEGRRIDALEAPGMTKVVGPAPVPSVAAPAPAAGSVPAPMQYLYGSGESAAASVQAYRALTNYLVARWSDRSVGHTVHSVLIEPGSSLASPRFAPCGDKPLAVVLDIDETVLLNLGYEANDAALGLSYDAERWQRWEATGVDKVSAVPGVVEAVSTARKAGIVVVYNSNRNAATAQQTAEALDRLGLGPVVHRDTLWLQGDTPGGSSKDARRQAIAAKYCVVALVGDQLGDFSDLFNAPGLSVPARRALANGAAVGQMWGLGWFMLPNPVYGSALRGTIDEVFPADKRWTDPGTSPAAAAPAPTPAPAE